MVCKEEVLTWFKDLDSYKRIDVLCELLNMLVPFELRFLGSCLEELAKQSYQELLTQTTLANDLDKLSSDVTLKNQTLSDDAVRHRVLLSLALLESRNYCCANWYSKMFLRTDYVEDIAVKEKDELVQNELLLLFTMASRHPAFSFDQKEFFNRILVQLCDLRNSRLLNKSNFGYPPGFGYPMVPRQIPLPGEQVAPLTTPLATTVPPGNFPMHPPGLPSPQPFMEYMAQFRPIPGIHHGAPEVAPFPHPLAPPPPPPSTTPPCSPAQSRSASPTLRSPSDAPPPPALRGTAPVLPPPLPPTTTQIQQPQSGVEGVVGASPVVAQRTAPLLMPAAAPPLPPHPLGMETTVISTIPPLPAQSSQPQMFAAPPPPPELPMQDEELVDSKVTAPPLLEEPKLPPPMWVDMKQPPNGVRFPYTTVNKLRLGEQMQSLTLTDTDSVTYKSNNSSSNNSPRDTPPSTPSATQLVPPLPRGPAPQPDKPRPLTNNGASFAAVAAAQPPPPFVTGEATSPPPPQPTGPAAPPFSACTVPYSYQSFVAPARAMFHYNAAFRPTAAAFPYSPYHHPTGETTTFPYAFPYFSFMYSSFPPAAAQQQQQQQQQPPTPPRLHPPGCYNCGSTSHVGENCTKPNIDELTRKSSFRLKYGDSPSPEKLDGDK